MAKFLTNINLNLNELQNAKLHILGTDPVTPAEGQLWYNSTTKRYKWRNDTTTYDITDALTLGGQTGAFYLGRANHTGAQAIGTVTGLQGALDAKIASTLIGANNGVAGLDGGGKVPAAQLPAYVDDVLEFANLAGFPATGSTGLIYVALDTNKIYRWSGSAYIEIIGSPGSTDAVTEGATNLYFTNERAQDAAATLFTGGTHSGISFVYDDALDKLNATVTAAGTVGKFSATVGDAAATSFSITQATHGRAANSTNIVTVQDASSGEVVYPDVTVNPANGTVTIAFSTPPSLNQYRVIVLG